MHLNESYVASYSRPVYILIMTQNQIKMDTAMIVKQDLLNEDDMRTSSMPKLLAGEIRINLPSFAVQGVYIMCVVERGW